jgi:hypothetical protein
VAITHVPSGTVSRTTTNAAGEFNASSLRVGGPYTADIAVLPSIARDPKDIIKVDPMIIIDPTNSDAVQGIESNGAVGTRYVYDKIEAHDLHNESLSSVWQIQFGLRYQF